MWFLKGNTSCTRHLVETTPNRLQLIHHHLQNKTRRVSEVTLEKTHLSLGFDNFRLFGNLVDKSLLLNTVRRKKVCQEIAWRDEKLVRLVIFVKQMLNFCISQLNISCIQYFLKPLIQLILGRAKRGLNFYFKRSEIRLSVCLSVYLPHDYNQMP